LTYQEVHVEQFESLFDTGDAAWRLEIRVKGGGGPFDPAGYSIQLISDTGRLELNLVHKCESQQYPINQLDALLAQAYNAYLSSNQVGELSKHEARLRFGRMVVRRVSE
jgi:hypothetical protein